MRGSLVVVCCWVASSSAAALTLTEKANPHAGAHEHLGAMRVIANQRVADHLLELGATAAEEWIISTNVPGVALYPASGTGPTTVTVRFTQPATTHVAGTITAHVNGGADVPLAVDLSVWPTVAANPSRDDVKAPSSWPNDPDYRNLWDLWGFLPDGTSHPGQAVNNVDSWERTPCSGGASSNCTTDGQAGLASGMSADRAWATTTGVRSVTLAVLDSGIRWRNRDVIEQVRLNAAELGSCPPPGAMAADPASYDVNHDGFFSIRDYDGADLEDWNNNGARDPQDLIHGTLDGNACSNGVDEDGNGFVDDIAGWDFFWDDNDPSDDTDFGHGDFEAHLSVGQANNGRDGVGVCPTCSLVPLRVGDTFIADVNRYAAAAVYAVDNDVSVIQQALGGLGNTAVMHQAVDYAYASNVPVIAAASDLLSYHHNWPANSAHAFMVHAIVYDGVNAGGAPAGSWREADTFLNFNNCTNYGQKLMLSAPGTGCSSEATAKTAGQAGLILSAWRVLQDAHPNDPYYARPLTTEEVYQVLVASADDINVPGAQVDADAFLLGKFVSQPGWDEHFGYGRNNAWRSVAMLSAKAVPPEVEITSPVWFSYVDGSSLAEVEVRGRVQNLRNTEDACFTLRWARGTEPTDEEFAEHVIQTTCVGAGLQPVKTLGSLPIAQLKPSEDAALARSRGDRTITVELTAHLGDGTTGAGVARTRRSFFVNVDPDLKAGFPKYLGVSGEASPRFADLNGDGRQELVVATSDGRLHAFTGASGELPGFPVMLVNPAGGCGGSVMRHQEGAGLREGHVLKDVGSSVVSSPAVGVLDKDGKPSIVVATTFGALFVVDANGQFRPGFPVCLDPAAMAETSADHQQADRRQRMENGFLSSPAVWDLEGDGVVDIVVGGGDGQLHVWQPDGQEKSGFPVAIRHPAFGLDQTYRDRVVSSPVLADLDGDGKLEIVVGSNERFDNQAKSALYAVYADGSNHVGGAFPSTTYPNGTKLWPQMVAMFTGEELLPTVGRGHPTSAAVVDLNNDGIDELITSGLGGYPAIFPDTSRNPDVPNMVYASEGFGPLSNSHEGVVLAMMNSPTVADLDGDGKPDIIQGLVGAGIAGLVSQGGHRFKFEHVVGAWDIASGTFHDGFPAVVEDFQILQNFPVADVDGDGTAEAIVATAGYFIHALRSDGSSPDHWPKFTGGFTLATPALGDIDGDGNLELAAITRDGNLFLWGLQGRMDSVQWAGFKHDAAGTGNRRLVELNTPPKDPPVDCGCSTTHTQSPSLGTFMLAVAGLALLRGRRGRS